MFVHGRRGAVYLAVNQASSPQSIGSARSWRIITDTDLIETSVLGYTWKTWLPRPHKWEIQAEGNVDTNNNTIFTALVNTLPPSAAPTPIYLYPDIQSNSGRFYSGNVWLKLTVDLSLRTVSRYTLGGTGDGPLTQN